jgi:hypothetical protein
MVKPGYSDNYLGLKTGDVVKSMLTGEIQVIKGFMLIDERMRYVDVIIGDYEDSDGWSSNRYVCIDDFQSEFDIIEV